MSILPTTQQLAEWLDAPEGEKIDTTHKAAALFEHVAHMAALNAAKVCHAVAYEIDPVAPAEQVAFAIAELIQEATQP